MAHIGSSDGPVAVLAGTDERPVPQIQLIAISLGRRQLKTVGRNRWQRAAPVRPAPFAAPTRRPQHVAAEPARQAGDGTGLNRQAALRHPRAVCASIGSRTSAPTPHASGRRGRANRRAARPPHSGYRMPLSGTRPPRWAAPSLHRRGAQLHAANDSRALAPGRRQGRGGCGTLDTRRPSSNCGGLRPRRQCCVPDCRYKARLSGARVQRKKVRCAGSGRLTEARAAHWPQGPPLSAGQRGAALR
jgi:hypothetical protein